MELLRARSPAWRTSRSGRRAENEERRRQTQSGDHGNRRNHADRYDPGRTLGRPATTALRGEIAYSLRPLSLSQSQRRRNQRLRPNGPPRAETSEAARPLLTVLGRWSPNGSG